MWAAAPCTLQPRSPRYGSAACFHCCRVSASCLAAVGRTKTCCKSLFPKPSTRSAGAEFRYGVIARGVALLVCGFCPNSSQLHSAGDCSGSLILPEPLQTLPALLTCNLCLPGAKCCGEMGAQSRPLVWLLAIRVIVEIAPHSGVAMGERGLSRK